MSKVLARKPIEIVGEDGEIDNDLELRVIKNEYGEFEIRAFYFKRYIHEDIFSGYEDDLESAIGTMEAEAEYHLENPDYIGNTDKFDIRSA